ncbi:hypothetical protein V6N13_050311 [Hibiscus sabdariffa]|uniref:Uncharacterized protein n=1 Tax=Hibiscus sabdariffa TaxID=183260 RepID=A0ABR2AA18_9ROSI
MGLNPSRSVILSPNHVAVISPALSPRLLPLVLSPTLLDPTVVGVIPNPTSLSQSASAGNVPRAVTLFFRTFTLQMPRVTLVSVPPCDLTLDTRDHLQPCDCSSLG